MRAGRSFPEGEDRLTFLGHSTVLMDMAGTRILTDPVLGHVMGSLRRHAPPVRESLLQGIDAVFVSHGHFDHLDLPSLRSLPGHPEVVLPRGLGGVVAGAGLGSIHEVTPGERIRIGSIEIEVVAAVHGRHRLPWVASVAATGCIASSGGRAVYFAGDTELFAEMAELAGRVDIALLPVGGWGPRLGAHHMNPERAAAAAAMIRPGAAVPIHWGTLLPRAMRRMVGPRFDAPGPAFVESLARLAPAVRAVVLAPGESMALGPMDAGEPVRAGATT